MKILTALLPTVGQAPRLTSKARKFWRPAAVVILSLLCLSACQRHQDTDGRLEDPLVPVVTAQPSESASRTFTGIVMARVQSNIGFRVPGKVIERLVDTGVSVKAGQPLMRLDQTDLLHEITNQEGAVAAAKAHAVQTAADLDRYRHLVAKGVVSVQDLDHAKADDDSAQSLLTAAEAQAQVAKDNDQYAELCADADGVVVETLAEPGQVVAAGQTVVRLAHSGPREASVNLPETVRPAIGSTARSTLYGNSQIFTARLRQLSDAADPLTRTFEARYVMEGEGAQAPLGATVTLTIAGSQTASDVSVPLGAIDDEGKGAGVWIYDSKTSQVTFRAVQLGLLGDEAAQITNGVQIGEQVIAMGGHYLHESEHVRVAEIKVAMQ